MALTWIKRISVFWIAEDGNAKNYDVEKTWFQYISLESHLKCLLWESIWDLALASRTGPLVEVPRFSPWRWERMLGGGGRWQNVILIGKRLFRLNFFFQLSLPKRISCLCFTGLRKLIKNLPEYEKVVKYLLKI